LSTKGPLFGPQAVLLLVTFVWGSTFVVTKDVLGQSPPLLYLSVRFVGAGLILLLLRRRPTAARTAGLWRDAIVVGALLISELR
jgi:drug/metabolite transporter (DMT)-like permease